MKRLFVLFIIAAGIYFANQHFTSTSYEEADWENSSDDSYSFSSESAQPIPENCKELVTNLENVISDYSSGKVSVGKRNIAYRKLKSCLRLEGFSDEQKDMAIKEIEARVKMYGSQR